LPAEETISGQIMLPRVIRDISRFALIKVDQASKSLQIHRLVQAVIRSQMTREEQLEVQHEVHEVLVGARPEQGDTDDPANWPTYELIWPHLVPSQAEECDDPRTRQLLIDWVRYQWRHGEFEACLRLAQRLQNLWTNQRGPDHPQTLHLQSQMANVLRSQGRFTEARDLDTHVLERQRAVLGNEHLLTLITANNLGADLRTLGEYQEALELDQQTYDSFNDEFGEDFEKTLAAAHNLACSLRLTGDYRTARRLDQENFDRCRAVLSPDHPSTMLAGWSLASDMRALGDFRDSVELLREIWQ
jgi:tetratricopeptide (TPR) repeat protein